MLPMGTWVASPETGHGEHLGRSLYVCSEMLPVLSCLAYYRTSERMALEQS